MTYHIDPVNLVLVETNTAPNKFSYPVEDKRTAELVLQKLVFTRETCYKKTVTGEKVPFHHHTLDETITNNKHENLIRNAQKDGWTAYPDTTYDEKSYNIHLIKYLNQQWYYHLILNSHIDNSNIRFYATKLQSDLTRVDMELCFTEQIKNLTSYRKTLTEVADYCPVCSSLVGVQNLNRVAFANPACSNCTPFLRNKLERAGWDN